MKVLWVAKAAAFIGGAERHIADVVPLTASRGASNYLFYDPNAPVDPAFTSLFAGAFPMVEPQRQIRALAPDLIYIHHLSGRRAAETIADAGIPTLRFFHDHAPFCLRVHKYTGFNNRTCARPLGAHCIVPCAGFLNRSPGFPPIRLRTLAAARAELAATMRFDAFAVGSVYMKDHVVAHGFSPAAVRVLPMFSISNPHGAGSAGDALAAPSEPVPARIPGLFLFVGALLRGKGLDTLLEALALLPAEVRLRVAGEGHQEGMFRSLAQSLGVVGRVEFLGRIPHADLSRHYREAACLVVPSRGPETFGLVGLEAFGHGTPVVASMAGGAGDWLIEGRTGFGFPPGDVQALASVLRRVLAEPAVALATAQRGRDLLQTRFSAERHLEALWNLFESLVRQGRQS